MTECIKLFKCPECGQLLEGLRPKDCTCGFNVPVRDNILQLTNMPDMVLESDGDKYIGYEHIGKNYSGYDGTYEINVDARTTAKRVKELVGNGILLDLGCGDGAYTIPFAQERIKVIAGDISNGMMRVLSEKASLLNVDMNNITLARMNALSIPLADKSVDAVIANSMLHLNSNPKRIIDEIIRVLKKNGIYICFSDKPNQEIKDEDFKKSKLTRIINEMHTLYFMYLKEQDISGKRLSWSFDRDAYCTGKFNDKKIISIRNAPKKVPNKLSDFTRRLSSKGFSDQSAIPDDIHKEVFNRLDKEMRAAYGEDYEQIQYESLDAGIEMIVYIK
ncbi:MAG: class I SAM-dependent methyltransferase [Eubacteriales bacterium]